MVPLQPAGPRALSLTFTADSYFVYRCGDDKHPPAAGGGLVCSINNSSTCKCAHACGACTYVCVREAQIEEIIWFSGCPAC